MKIYSLLSVLKNQNDYVGKEALCKSLGISQSSLRTWIGEANSIGTKNGFNIRFDKGKGYYLNIENEELFNIFLSKKDSPFFSESMSKDQRIQTILFLLFQTNDYISYEKISGILNVSKSTIIRDVRSVDEILKSDDLSLNKKAHFGIKIEGNEKRYRESFSKHVLQNNLFFKPIEGIDQIVNKNELSELRSLIKSSLGERNMFLSDTAFENIVTHLEVLIYRARRNNFIENTNKYEIDDNFYKAASTTTKWIEREYHVSIPESETEFLAAQISGKIVSDSINSNEKKQLEVEIRKILSEIDEEFLTETKEDEELVSALVMHVFPLLNRMYHNISLNNPLIDEVYSAYANVFLLAIKFSDHIKKTFGFDISKDEVGYIALHFAAHFERKKNKAIERFKKITVICTSGGGSAQLIKLKLQTLFPKATVTTTSQSAMESEPDADLILSSVPIDQDCKVPIIYIKELLDEDEIRRIEEILVENAENTRNEYIVEDVSSLISKDLFYINPKGKDYFDVLRFMCDDAARKGYAVNSFYSSVEEREKRFETIYKNGIAGPHPMAFDAYKDSVSVSLFDPPLKYKDREINIIFLINLKKGHLSLHKKMSGVIFKIIEDESLLRKLVKCKSFEQFRHELRKNAK